MTLPISPNPTEDETKLLTDPIHPISPPLPPAHDEETPDPATQGPTALTEALEEVFVDAVEEEEPTIYHDAKSDDPTYRNTRHCHEDVLCALHELKTTGQYQRDMRAQLLLESYERLSHNLDTQANWSLLTIVGSVIGMAGAGFGPQSRPGLIIGKLGDGTAASGQIIPKFQEPYNKAIEGLQTQLNNLLTETRESIQDVQSAKREIDNKLLEILKLKSQMEQESLRSRI